MNPELLESREGMETDSSSRRESIGSAAVQLSKEVTLPEENELKDRRIARLTPIYTPNEVIGEVPQSEKSYQTVENSRKQINDILRPDPNDDRLLVIVGPCSINDPGAANEYAGWLSSEQSKHSDDLLLVMRTYLEKPRTTVGWKGLINDPHLDGSFSMNEGLLLSRQLLLDITEKGVPVATELLDTDTPQYLDDLVSYGPIGARTTESQLHRELVSGVSMPCGFKNGTGGSIQIGIDAMKAAAVPHTFFGIDKEGKRVGVETKGNPDTNLILRGSTQGPNFYPDKIAEITKRLEEAGVNPALIVDTSHANSRKDYLRQPLVAKEVANQVAKGNTNIRGLMIESNLVEGAQKLDDPKNLVYGQSITDACVGLGDTGMIFKFLSTSVQKRRMGA